MKLNIDIDTIKGFLDPAEGQALYEQSKAVAHLGPSLEIGSYCGKSTVYIGQACKETGRTLFAVDHHRGSEEHQLGEEYHDADLFDENAGLLDSFRAFRHTLRIAELEDTVVPIVASSSAAARNWATPLAFVFIDGGHSMEAAMADYRSWVTHIVSGGILAVHDLFPNPEEGDQAPITIYNLAIASGLFEKLPVVKTLGVLRRI